MTSPESLFPPPWACSWGTDKVSNCPYAGLRLSETVTMRLRLIPAGSFLMGSPQTEEGRDWDEGPQHRVTLTRGFWLAETPCTQAQWQAVMGANPSRFQGGSGAETALRPVERVSWEDCQKFCQRLDRRLNGLGARLPTEAEWEYACRAGTESAFNDGSACTSPHGEDAALNALGWYGRNSSRRTHKVQGKAPNGFGLWDLHGNVREWCEDVWREYAAEEVTDPFCAPGGSEALARIVSGGSWNGYAKYCRSAVRGHGAPSRRINDLGFRLATGQ